MPGARCGLAKPEPNAKRVILTRRLHELHGHCALACPSGQSKPLEEPIRAASRLARNLHYYSMSTGPAGPTTEEKQMFARAMTIIVLALLAGLVLGLTGVAGSTDGMAPAWLLVMVLVVGAVAGSVGGRPPL